MEFSQRGMLTAAFYALVIGALLGLLYDICRALRSLLSRENERYERALFFTFDILYSIAVALTFILLVYHTNYGRLRWFIIAGSVVGFAAYRATLGRLIVILLGCAVRIVRRLIALILLPIKKLARVIIKFTKFTIASPIKRLYNIYKNKLKSRRAAPSEPDAPPA